MSQEVSEWLVNGHNRHNPNITQLWVDYYPFANHLLTSWDMQVGAHVALRLPLNMDAAFRSLVMIWRTLRPSRWRWSGRLLDRWGVVAGFFSPGSVFFLYLKIFGCWKFVSIRKNEKIIGSFFFSPRFVFFLSKTCIRCIGESLFDMIFCYTNGKWFVELSIRMTISNAFGSFIFLLLWSCLWGRCLLRNNHIRLAKKVQVFQPAFELVDDFDETQVGMLIHSMYFLT